MNTALFFAAWSLRCISDIRSNDHWFAKSINTSQVYIARLSDDPVEKERTWKLPVEVLNSITNNKVAFTTGKALLYVYKDQNELPLHKGDTILLPNNWQPIKNAGNPFEFNYAAYCAQNNLYYQQFLASKDIRLIAHAGTKDITAIDKAHNWYMQQLAHYIKDSSTLGLIQAMLIGDEVNLDPNLRQAYSETGIIHVIAISGSNVTIFFIVISFLLSWIRHRKYHWIKYVVALPLVWFYVLMAGAAPSAMRAAIMFSILALGFAFQRNNNSLNQLFATAVVLLCASPMWLFSLGFQLSFLAVLSLILFYAPVYRLIPAHNMVTKALWKTIAASIAAEILVAPLIVYYFHLFPALFIISNVLAFLFMGLVLILGMLVIVFSAIPTVASAIASITVFISTHFNALVYKLQQLNPSSFHFLSLSFVELLFLYITIAGIAVFLLKKKKPAFFISLSSLCLLLCFLCIDEWHALHQRRLIVYNISHTNYIEIIQGKTFSILHTDSTLDQQKKNYALKPAHTGWHAWQRSPLATNEIIQLGQYKILLLNEEPQLIHQPFPIDYLVINYKSNNINLSQLQQTFTPRLIILGSNNTRKTIEKYLDTAIAAHISLHAVTRNGAFILDAF
ncbi:MAG: ComEC/Rec2 family competence protein [Flavipsychrobacter sp.]